MENQIIKVGQSYTLRNGLKTSPIRRAIANTSYIFEADVQEPQYDTPSILCWKGNGKYLTNIINHKFDIIL